MKAVFVSQEGTTQEIEVPADIDELDIFLSDLFKCYSICRGYNESRHLCCFQDDSFYISHGTPEDYAREENKRAMDILQDGYPIYGDALFLIYTEAVEDNICQVTFYDTSISDVMG